MFARTAGPNSNSGLMGSNGWQEVDFSQPVTIDANTTYIASYFAPNGHYSANSAYFYTTPPMGTNPTITTVNSPPLQSVQGKERWNNLVLSIVSYRFSEIPRSP